MMDLRTIQELSRQAGAKARRKLAEPFVPTAEVIERAKGGDLTGIKIPTLGDYVPRDWKRIDKLFVDTSGFGAPGELALTFDELVHLMEPGIGYGLIEAGQFQGYLGVFRRKE